ncbi:hypothetical protein HON71_04165 [Candidatus Woesearchaeota archaeon]|jgi:hypothetical protein|nr:hypothetical protein [Candidatus Woesearchaeota archaeon]MBT5342543.1 hypothetical protein [Candidatus Woesearchaeota archaeon]
MKKIIMLLSVLVIAMFIVGCVEEVSDEELNAELEELSDEEFVDVVSEEEPGALVGNARARPISKTRSKANKLTWTCTDDGNEVTYASSSGYKKIMDKNKCLGANDLYEIYCDGNKMKWDKVSVCENGCEDGACVQEETIEVAPEEDSWLIDTNAKDYEMANNHKPDYANGKGIEGETIKDIAYFLGDEELPSLLSNGKIVVGGDDYKTQQFMFLGSDSNQNGIVKYTEDDNDETGIYFFFQSGQSMARYRLEFQQSPGSAIVNNQLVDFKNLKIVMLGKEYTILEATKFAGTNSLQLTLEAEGQLFVLKDNDITNEVSTHELEVGDEMIGGAEVMLVGVDNGNSIELNYIEINMVAEDSYFVGTDKLLTDAIKDQGEEPEVLFGGNWNFAFAGFNKPEDHDVILNPITDMRYNLNWFDSDNNLVLMPLAYAKSQNVVVMGEEANENALVIAEDVTIRKNDYFVLTGGTAVDGSAKSYLLQYKGADQTSSSNPEIRFKNMGSGESLDYSINDGVISNLKFGGFTFVVEGSSDMNQKDFNISVDLNGNGVITNDQVLIVDSYGAQIAFGEYLSTEPSAELSSIELLITTPNADDYDNQVPTDITLEITPTNGPEVRTIYGGLSLLTPEDEVGTSYGYTSMGAEIKFEEPSGKPDIFKMNYPKEQRLPRVYIIGDVTAVQE